jgi:glutaredoxin
MRFSRSTFALMLALSSAPTSAHAAPDVVMFGATWCGPCRAVKQHLEANRVPFTYRDIDDERHRAAFIQEGAGGIPLVLVGREKIRGANLERLRSTLERAGIVKPAAPSAAAAKGETYGGHPAAWWQAQFRELRAQVAEAGEKARALEKVAGDDVEKGVVAKLKEERGILEASLDQLENDASNVALPRKYRE